jgi:hypothetical protein
MCYTLQRGISRSLGRGEYSRGSGEWKKKGKKKINAEDHRGTEGAEKRRTGGRVGSFSFFTFNFKPSTLNLSFGVS